MRLAMAEAEVGDSVYGDDPTVNALEREMAELLGKEAALFVSTGTMGNQMAIACQTRPGDEVVVGEGAHPIWYEGGAGAALNGIQFAVAGSGGFFSADDLRAALKPRAYYSPRPSLVAIENTHNRAGGRIFPGHLVDEIVACAKEHRLGLHLDGARLWNVSAATGVSLAKLAAPFDTVTVCFSKGLGAPAGSALAGPRELIEEARRLRHRWGGAMRQVGILAAAARYAVLNNRARLVSDHANAKRLAERLGAISGVSVALQNVETNIVNADVDRPADRVVAAARERGVMMNAIGPKRVRLVTHLDVRDCDIEPAAQIFADAMAAT